MHTFVTQMLSKLHIPMPPRRDMEIPLHLITLQTAKNPTRIIRQSPRRLRRLPKRPLPPPHLTQHMTNMGILLLSLLPRRAIALVRRPMHVLPLRPQRPGCRVPPQHVPREDPVS